MFPRSQTRKQKHGEFMSLARGPSTKNQKIEFTIHIDEMGHIHSGAWLYFSNSQHRRICLCGETFYEVHCVEYQDSRDGYAKCLGCGANLDLALDFADIIRSVGNRQVTLNGSYILPSGVVVLKEEDIDAYLAGTLVFYNENELPTCV